MSNTKYRQDIVNIGKLAISEFVGGGDMSVDFDRDVFWKVGGSLNGVPPVFGWDYNGIDPTSCHENDGAPVSFS